MSESEKEKEEAKAKEKARIEAEREARQRQIPGTEPTAEPQKRGPGRPPGTKAKGPEGAAGPVPRQKRKPIEETTDTDKALRKWFEDGKKLEALHLKKHPEARIGVVNPFTVKREKLAMKEDDVIDLCDMGFHFLGNALRVPSSIPDKPKIDMIGGCWSKALPYMNVDAGKFYVGIALVLTGGVVLSMLALSVARLLGKYKDPQIDEIDSQLAPHLAMMDEGQLGQVEAQLRAQMKAELEEIERRRAELRPVAGLSPIAKPAEGKP